MKGILSMKPIPSNKAFSQILTDLDHYKKKDFSFSTGRILGSMCTMPHPIAQEAYARFLDTNIGDSGLTPGTNMIEQQFLSFIKTMLHAPVTARGHSVSGGTEGNISAMWIAKQLTGKREILVPSSGHFSFQKIASLLDVKIRTIPLTKEYIMDVTALKQMISDKTAAVVGIAGSTDLGTIDPITEIAQICQDNTLFLHVDAAFGGFIIPFLQSQNYNLPDFDFSIPGVSTISVDAHKMGQVAIPLGSLILRDPSWLELISVPSPCITSPRQSGILGTRPGGPIAAAYAVTKYLGEEGYKTITKQCMKTTHYTIKRLHEIGLEVIIKKPPLNVLAVKLNHLQEIVDLIEQQKWKVNSLYHLSSIRLVLMPHVTTETIDEFIPVLKNICEEVGEL
jgi:tyrosine decarboxylase/aspartate 1-decarboxylase